jgi:hypothetical protein
MCCCVLLFNVWSHIIVEICFQAPHNVIRYTYRGQTAAAANLFFVNSVTSEVSLSRALQADTSSSFYEVSIYS